MNKLKLEKMFVFIALIFGSIILLLTPPFNSPDEDTHFVKSYILSKGQLFPKIVDGKSGAYVPNTIIDFKKSMTEKAGNVWWEYDYDKLYFDELLTDDFNQVSFVSILSTSPIAHIVPATGIVVAKLFSGLFFNEGYSVTYLLQFARFFSLIGYIFIVYFAIKNTPVLKKSMFTIALLPMSLFLVSNVSYDMLLISCSLLFISKVLQLKCDDTKKMMSLGDIFVLGCCLFVFISIKYIYVLIGILLLLIPKKKINKNNLKQIIIVGLALLTLFILMKVLTPSSNVSSDTVSTSQLQIKFILENPIKYSVILVKNIVGQKTWLLFTTIGCFGLLDTYVSPVFILTILFGLILILVSDGVTSKVKIKLSARLLPILIIICLLALIYTAMYIYWIPHIDSSDVGGSSISGVQGRYLIPLLILIPIMFFKSKIKNKSIQNILLKVNNSFVTLFILFGLTVSCITLLIRFWC